MKALVLLLYIGEVSFGILLLHTLPTSNMAALVWYPQIQIIALYWVLMFVKECYSQSSNAVNKHYLFSLSCIIAALISAIAVYQNHVWIGYLMCLSSDYVIQPLYPIIYAQALHASASKAHKGQRF